MNISIDCPLCTGQATTDAALTSISCAGCGVDVEIAPDPVIVLDAVA